MKAPLSRDVNARVSPSTASIPARCDRTTSLPPTHTSSTSVPMVRTHARAHATDSFGVSATLALSKYRVARENESGSDVKSLLNGPRKVRATRDLTGARSHTGRPTSALAMSTHRGSSGASGDSGYPESASIASSAATFTGSPEAFESRSNTVCMNTPVPIAACSDPTAASTSGTAASSSSSSKDVGPGASDRFWS